MNKFLIILPYPLAVGRICDHTLFKGSGLARIDSKSENKMTVTNLEINDTEIFNDDAELTVLNNSANSSLDCINGLTIQFEVTVTNAEGEEKDFTIAFQNSERNNGMMAYNGYDIDRATIYGYDADESEELEVFMGYDTCFNDVLYAKAKELSKEALAEMLN